MTLQEILALPKDRMLTNVAIEFRNNTYIADRLVPVVPVVLEQAGYYTFDDGNYNIPEAKRNPRAVYKEIDFGMSTDSYYAEEYGIEARIDDRERRNSPGALDLDVSKTRRTTNAILLNRERRIANLLTNTANVPMNTTLAGAAKWSDPTSDPAGVATTAKAAIRNASGYEANVMMIPRNVADKLRVHPQLIDFFDGGRPALTDLADFFEVEQVYFGATMYNTAKEGQATSLAQLWTNDVLFAYRSGIVAAEEPSFAYQFEAQALNVWRYREVKVKCDVIGVGEIRAEKITSTRLVYLVKSAI